MERTIQDLLQEVNQRATGLMRDFENLANDVKVMIGEKKPQKEIDDVYEKLQKIVIELKPLHQSILNQNPDVASLFYTLMHYKRPEST